MSDVFFGRYNLINEIKKYAESHYVGNQAFLGLRGVGKTSLFQRYFTKMKKNEIAEKYRKLFVISKLDSRKHGSDLYLYLIDQVIMGIRCIPDRNERTRIEEEKTEINKNTETPESRLSQYLELLKENGYELVIVMDHFHCMARDNGVGSEQYEVLRSLNENKSIVFWIITDTDLMETCATKEYMLSFFAQKFTNRMTIGPLNDDSRKEVVEYFAKQKKYEISEDEKDLIAVISGGIPEIMSILIDILVMTKREGSIVTKDHIEQRFLCYDAGVSIFKSWISGLSNRQKLIIYNIASTEAGLRESDEDIDYALLSELSDNVGRGLLHTIKDDDERIWVISIDLFKQYVLNCGPAFYEEDDSYHSEVTNLEPQIINNFYVEGNYIQTQTNNVINISDAVNGLETLKKMVSNNRILLDRNQVVKKLELLPFAKNLWNELDESEQENELNKFSEGIFSSDILSEGSLNDTQMKAFCIDDSLLDSLTDTCKNQIICGIQVYDLIQLCIDRFGLKMNESESPRGILFARAFESHLKDYAAPAFGRIPQIADKIIPPLRKKFIDYPIDKTTIGTYSSIIEQEYKTFSLASVRLLNDIEKNDQWWDRLSNKLIKICALRNKCCHSGTKFDYNDLLRLKQLIFGDNSLKDILVFGRISELQPYMYSQLGALTRNAVSIKPIKSNYAKPDPLLVGQRVKFKILEKTNNKRIRGEVNGKYLACLSKIYARRLDYPAIKNTEIDVVVDKIQDNRYVLRLP